MRSTPIAVLTDTQIRAMIDQDLVRAHRARASARNIR